MKKALLITSTIMMCLSCCAQQKINIGLKQQLDSILASDQGIREFVDTETSEARKDQLAKALGYSKEELKKKAWSLMNKIDSANFKKVESIVSKYGYPGKSLVGEPANTAVFFVIQHTPSQISKYYPLIEKAGKEGELPFENVAMMLDRKLTGEGKLQIYGTQIYSVQITNPKTGQKEFFEYVMPIEDAKNVNKRRKEAGFKLSVEENAKRFGIIYKAYTPEEIKKITNP
ncbi:DUF6624 domain-containing protein [Pedobacter sp. KR3-3]|uniref:DUF6624 domain-containing protein n=1 Tax=Pedobacter albus TaxID=3113905 RepID=A0ABU7I7P7_9SPHI|nr:DUF6624 domain-containing protein [Pedobacter sp. KR3-3]MEE1945495.1 DUF6624 domain-containing protein [Pedobacter sp. KR3-3]